VLLTYRVERPRMTRRDPTGEELLALKKRCLELLDDLRSSLDGAAAWHLDVLAEIAAARAEVALED
jgi:hypothetical protein